MSDFDTADVRMRYSRCAGAGGLGGLAAGEEVSGGPSGLAVGEQFFYRDAVDGHAGDMAVG